MPSETDILNAALSRIGAARITAIDDGTVNANHCLTLYPILRQAVLRAHFWNFAETRVELAQDATPPLFSFAFSYTLPADFIRMREYNGIDFTVVDPVTRELVLSRYRIEGRKLVTNDGTVKIVYVRDVTDPNIWDALFRKVVITWLAGDLASAITKDAAKAKALLEEAVGLLLPIASAVDGQEGSPVPYIVDDLIRGR